MQGEKRGEQSNHIVGQTCSSPREEVADFTGLSHPGITFKEYEEVL